MLTCWHSCLPAFFCQGSCFINLSIKLAWLQTDTREREHGPVVIQQHFKINSTKELEHPGLMTSLHHTLKLVYIDNYFLR